MERSPSSLGRCLVFLETFLGLAVAAVGVVTAAAAVVGTAVGTVAVVAARLLGTTFQLGRVGCTSRGGPW